MPILRVKDNSGWRDIPALVGPTPNLQIGTVETLPAGSEAAASITGTAENPLLNLGIPRGADGGAGEWQIIADMTLEESTVINTGSMPTATEMLFLYAAPATPDGVVSSGAGNSFGAPIYYHTLTDTQYGAVGMIYSRKMGANSITFYGTYTSSSVAPLFTSVRRTVAYVSFTCTDNATDIPLRLAGALPVGTKIKLLVR